MRKISYEMRRVLKKLTREPASATELRCSIRTLCALEERRLIRVETSFQAIMVPRKALAYITEDGRAAVFQLRRDPPAHAGSGQ